MNTKLPKVKAAEFRIENRARKLVTLCFNDDWMPKEEIGRDFGRDLMMEYTEDGYATNKRISIQIKGRAKLKIFNDKIVSFPLHVRTISYALNELYPFFLFLNDLYDGKMYFIEIKSYFSNNIEWRNNKETYNIHIPIENINYLDF